MLIDPGDHILVESPTYSGSLAALRPLDCIIHGKTIGLNWTSKLLCADVLPHVHAKYVVIFQRWPRMATA